MQLASRDGLEGLTIGSLSDALSLSKSGLFAHFGSKEALQLAVLEHARDRFSAHLAPYLDGVAKGLPTLQALVQALFDWVALPELPAGCPILGATFELEAREGPLREFLVKVHGDSRARMSSMVQEAVDAGHLDRDLDVVQFIFELRGIVLAFHETLHVSRSPQARTRANRAIAALVKRHAPASATRRPAHSKAR